MNVELKRKAEALNRLHRELMRTIQILSMDLRFAEQQSLKDHFNEQFWRRTTIRCVCALVEGTLSVLKSVTPETASLFQVNLTEKDIEIITELRKDKNGFHKPAFLKPNENVKETIKLFAKAHAIKCPAKFDEKSFDDLCKTFELRNKLMHPKNSFSLEVKNEFIKTSVSGWNWLDRTLDELLAESGRNISRLKT